jgi:hypothetical protein
MSVDDSSEEEIIATGWDRGLDFEVIKNKLIKHLEKLNRSIHKANSRYEHKILTNKICYTIIAMIQLRNGSRISEACETFIKFINSNDLNSKIIVKIAKTTGKQYSRTQKKMIDKKKRYRKMIFPDWINQDIIDEIRESKPLILLIQSKRLKNRVCDFLRMYFDCNTHSLRYAYINYMLTDKQMPMATVAKVVGHVNVNQLVTYTQQKNVDAALDMDI